MIDAYFKPDVMYGITVDGKQYVCAPLKLEHRKMDLAAIHEFKAMNTSDIDDELVFRPELEIEPVKITFLAQSPDKWQYTTEVNPYYFDSVSEAVEIETILKRIKPYLPTEGRLTTSKDKIMEIIFKHLTKKVE